MKLSIKILIVNFLFSPLYLYADDPYPGELFIYNKSSSDYIKVNVYPGGAVFNGAKEYRLYCANPSPPNIPNPYIVGCSKSNIPPDNGQVVLNHDVSEAEQLMDGAIGFGKYRIDFYKWNGSAYAYVNYCYIDFGTSDYPFTGHPYLYADISIEYNNENSITYGGVGCNLPGDRTIKIWDQTCFRGPNAYKEQNKSGFKTASNDQYGNWLNFPLDARNYQGLEPWGHETPFRCFLNVDIQYNHQPKLVCNKTFETFGGSIFWLRNSTNGASKFYVGVGSSSCNATFTNNGGCYLIIWPYTEFIVEQACALNLKRNSHVTIHQNGKLWMKPGSVFCNEGADVRAYGTLLIQGVVRRFCPDPTPDESFFSDSVKVVLDTNSVLELSDSTFWTFLGNETQLICKEGSTIRFGKGSKLVFTDGARINAKHTKFTSYDSNTTWN